MQRRREQLYPKSNERIMMSRHGRYKLPDWVAYVFAQLIAWYLRRWLG